MAAPAGPSASTTNLVARSAAALKWNYAGVAVRTLSQLAIGVALARVLGPEPFGIVAIAWLVIGACNLFADFGLASALVQKESLDDRDVRFVFTCQLALGAALTAVGWAATGWIETYFRLSNAVEPLRAMFSIFVIQALGQTSSALLRRELDFRYVQQVSIGSYLLGYLVIGIPAALGGLGVWALVAANIVQAATSSVALVVRTRRSLGWAASPSSGGLFQFGGKVVAANLSSWALSNLDSLFVGRMLGIQDLGLYNRATMLVSSPMGTIVSGLQGVLFSAASRAQSRPAQLQRAYLGATSAVALVCGPLFLSIAAVSDTVVVGLYGGQWAAAAAPLTAIALAMPLTALLAVAGPVLMSLDRVADEVRAQIVALLVMLALLAFGAMDSIAAVAWVMLLVHALRWLLLARAILGALRLPVSAMLTALATPLVLAVLVVLGVALADLGLRTLDVGASKRLVIVTLAGLVALAGALRLLGRRLLAGDLGAFLRSRGSLPTVLARWMNTGD